MSKAEAPKAEMKSHWPMSVMSTLSSLINMLLPLALVRVLTPEEIGQFKIFFLYIIIVPAASFMPGILNGLSYWAGQPKIGAAAVRISSLITISGAVAMSLVTFLARVPLAREFGWSVGTTTIFSIAIFGTMASTFYEDFVIASGRIWRGALFSSGLDLLRTITILVTALLTHNLAYIFLAHLFVQLGKTILGYTLGYREGFVSFKWDAKMFKAVWKYAFPVSVAWGFGVFVSYCDQMILSRYLSNADFAFYSIGCLTVGPLLTIETSVTRVLIPQMASAFAHLETSRAAALYRKSVAELAYITLPAVTGMIVFATPIIEMLFTSRYASAGGYLEIYAFFYLTQIIPNDAVARARGEGKWILSNFIIFSILTVGSCWVLTMQFGPYGTLAGLISSRFAMKFYAIYFMKTTTPWKFSEFLPFTEAARSAAVCAALAGLCLAVKPLFHAKNLSDLTWFFVMGPVFTVLYFAITLSWSRDMIPAPIAARLRAFLPS